MNNYPQKVKLTGPNDRKISMSVYEIGIFSHAVLAFDFALRVRAKFEELEK